MRLAKKEYVDYKGKVYDLTVENTHSYNIDGIAVHNSSAGSIVAFLLYITDIDPLRFNLIFERFINPDRLDYPDIDTDFMSAKRHMVIDYITEKYGEENVAGISNYTSLGAASALRDAGRVYGLSPFDMSCSKQINNDNEVETLEQAKEKISDVDAFSSKYPTVWHHALNVQNAMRGLGQHAAGFVIAGEPIVNRAVLERRSGGRVVNWDKRSVEDWGLIKMDILGLSTLDVLSKAKEIIKERTGEDIDYLQISLDDEITLDNMGEGNTVGVFQFESPGLRSLLKNLAESGRLTFTDLMTATALYRPGPMESGLLDEYVAIRQGYKEPFYEHPLMEPALKDTYGIMIFQESVMQIARDLCGFTMAEADLLRKAVGKKSPELMASMREKWIEGAGNNGMDENQASELFDKVEKFAGYSFNASHSVAYSVISFWTMWLKTHYPAEFYAASLSIIDKEDKIKHLTKDAAQNGIRIMPPDINISSDRFEIAEVDGKLALFSAFQSLKGISDKGSNAIITAREDGPFLSKADFLNRVNKRLINKRHQETLQRVGAFTALELCQTPATHESRLKAQIELMPGLIVQNVKANRGLTTTQAAKNGIIANVVDYRACQKCDLAPQTHPMPLLGSDKARIMVVMDSPTKADVSAGKIMGGKSGDYVNASLSAAGLKKKDCYFTTTVKAEKNAKQLTNAQIIGCEGFLNREVELLKPAVIVALGGTSIRHFLPNIKGSISELTGQVHYVKDLDASVICGITPSMIYFDGNRQNDLDDVFVEAANLLL